MVIDLFTSALIGLAIGLTSTMFSRNNHLSARLSNILTATFGSFLVALILYIFDVSVPVLVASVVGSLLSLMILIKLRGHNMHNLV